jgi:hypothetical protein
LPNVSTSTETGTATPIAALTCTSGGQPRPRRDGFLATAAGTPPGGRPGGSAPERARGIIHRGVDDDLRSRRVALGTADHEAAGRVHEDARVGVHQV